MQRRLQALTLQIALVVLAASPALAQTYPDRTVKIVVPFPAGGTADAVPRIVGDWLSRKWGQPVVIENKNRRGRQYRLRDRLQRASGRIHLAFGATAAARHQPQPLSKTRLRSHEIRTHHRDGTCAERVDRQSEQDQGVERGGADRLSQGEPRQGHRGDTRQRHDVAPDVRAFSVDGKSEAPAHPLSRVGAGAAGPARRRRRLDVRQSRSFAAAGRRPDNSSCWRSPQTAGCLQCPNVPTIAETLPGFEAVAWYAIVAPPKTPKAIVDKINADVNEALAQPEIQVHLKKLSAEVFGGSVDKTAKYLRGEIDRWGGVIKAAKIEIQ